MSHISRIKTKMEVKEFILKALEDLGYRYEESGQITSGLGEKTQVDIKINLRLSYDIGLKATPNGYEIVADWWGVRGVKRNEFSDRLMQRYAYHATKAKLEEQGFTLVSEENQKNGQIRLVLRRVQ
ncbi:MAG TPA: DUF1257 domain-containing protein [Anaerolineaceae bacterium]|nr:DUF1257 domain-containing protein [Anaerolineaceae bacterium]